MEKQIRKLKKRILINDIILIILLGIISNLVVMVCNDSKMPVRFSESEERISLPNEYVSFNNFNEVKYGFLGDVLKVETKYFISRNSIGDILIFSGIITLILVLIFYKGGKDGIVINYRK